MPGRMRIRLRTDGQSVLILSVIIPHLNQPTHLEHGLQALAEQEDVQRDVEIIVVDNGSSELPEAICARWPNVRLAQEAAPGPGPARNRGIAAAQGDLLAFIDADCRAHPRWLASIEAAFADPETQVIGGDVQVPFADPAHPTALECYERIYAYRNRKYIASGYSGTGNLAMRRSAYEAVGPFGGIEIAEDRDWGHRAGAAGIGIRYVPEMIVYHPARTEFAEMRRKWDRHIAHDFSNLRGAKGAVRWILRALAIAASPIGELPRILTSSRIRGPKQRLLAFWALVRIRLYRAWRMLALLLRPGGKDAGSAWR